jgi:hypothetical protein
MSTTNTNTTSSTTTSTNTNTSINKPNLNDPENRIVHVLVTGLFVFIIIILVLSVISFFMYSNVSEAYDFREIFNPHKELIPKLFF